MNESTETTAPETTEATAPEPETEPPPEPPPVEPIPDNELAAQLRELATALEADRQPDGPVRNDEQDVLMRIVTAELFRRISKTYAEHDAKRVVDETERVVVALETLAQAGLRIAETVESWTGSAGSGAWLDIRNIED